MFKPYNHLIFEVLFCYGVTSATPKGAPTLTPTNYNIFPLNWAGYKIQPSHQDSTDCDTRPILGHWQQIYRSIFHNIYLTFCNRISAYSKTRILFTKIFEVEIMEIFVTIQKKICRDTIFQNDAHQNIQHIAFYMEALINKICGKQT
jgi:hypothetical protein